MHKVIITRPIDFALPLQSALQEKNIQSFIFPTIDIKAIDPLSTAISSDYFIFVSRNAVKYGQALLNHKSRTLAIGKGTYQALQDAGYTPVIKPEKPYNSEKFLQHPQLPLTNSHHISIIKGAGGREFLYKQLQKQVASVQTIDVYERCISQPSDNTFLAYKKLIYDNNNIIFINSIEALDNLLLLTPQNLINSLLNQQLISGSARVILAAEKIGFVKTAILADSTVDNDMINCLLTLKQTK